MRDSTDGFRPKYVVYASDFSDSPLMQILGAVRARGVFHILGTLAINLPQFEATRGNLFDPAASGFRGAGIYQTLAHEFFHSIQIAYQLRFDFLGTVIRPLLDPAGLVVIEGGAEGAAMYMVSQKFPGYLETRASDREETGAFPYHLGFLVDRPLPEQFSPYWAGSFWFHLAERFGSFSVIEYVLRQPLPAGSNDAERRIRWLEKGLQQHPGIEEGLYTVYSHFLTELASYGAGRYQRVQEKDWHEWLFGGCGPITMTPETEAEASRKLDIFGEMAGACTQIAWRGFPENAALQIEAEYTDKEALDQINLGIAASTQSGGTCWKWRSGLPAKDRPQSTCLVEKPRILTGPTEGTWVRTWELPRAGYGASGDAFLVLTNTAVEPWKTKSADGLVIRFGFSRTEDQTGHTRGPSEAEHLRVPVPKPGYMKHRTYGINPDPALPDNPVTPPIPAISIPKGDGSSGVRPIAEPQYKVKADPREPIPLGYTGPFYGFVEMIDPNLPMGAGNVGSLFCYTGEEERMQIGEVLVAEKHQLKVHVKADLCKWEFGKPGPFPVVDHLDAIVVLAFGWRYQKHPPRDEVTPGVELFVDRFHDRVQGILGGQWPYGGPESGPTPPPGAASASGDPGAPSPTGEGSESVGTVTAACDCTCDGFEEFQKMSREQDDPDNKARFKQQAMTCAAECMAQWMACAQRRR